MALTRSEAGALGLAAVGHLALFGLLSIGFLATPNPDMLKPQPIEVAISDEVGLESAAPTLSSEPPKTQIAPEEGPVEPDMTPPQPAPLPQPQPDPQPVARPAPPAPAPKPAPAKPAPAKPAAAAPSRPAPAKPAAPAAAARPQQRPVRPTGLLGADFEKGLTAQQTQGQAQTPPATTIGPQVKSALAAEILRQIKPHWTPPSGADSDKLRTKVKVSLNKDGSLAGEPRVTQTGITESNQSQAALHRERAIRAVKLSAPFRLPPQYYDAWKTIEPNLYEGL